jgi:hypothetical protein
MQSRNRVCLSTYWVTDFFRLWVTNRAQACQSSDPTKTIFSCFGRWRIFGRILLPNVWLKTNIWQTTSYPTKSKQECMSTHKNRQLFCQHCTIFTPASVEKVVLTFLHAESQSFLFVFPYLSVGTMSTGHTCCHLPGEMLNLAAKAADRARIKIFSVFGSSCQIFFSAEYSADNCRSHIQPKQFLLDHYVRQNLTMSPAP